MMPVLRAFERRFRDSDSEEGTVMATVLAYVISDAESSGRREILAAFRADESIHSLFDQGLSATRPVEPDAPGVHGRPQNSSRPAADFRLLTVISDSLMIGEWRLVIESKS